MLNALMQLARPALLVLDPETAHETTLRALEKGLYPADRSADPPTLAARLGGLALTNPIGDRRRLRQGRARAGCGPGPRLRVCRDRHRDAARRRPAIRSRGVFRLINERGVINRLGFNNGGHAAALARLEARAGARHRRRQHRRQQGRGRPHRRLRHGHQDLLRRRELFHRQHLVAQHAGLARPAGAGRPRRTARPRDGGARPAGGRRQAPPADRRQDRARHCRGRHARRSPSGSPRTRSTRIAVSNTTLARPGAQPHRHREGGWRAFGPTAVPPLDGDAGARSIRQPAARCR